jgi:hypothetical protein
MFAGLNSEYLQDLLEFFASRTEELRAKGDLLSAEAVANSLLPKDDSSLQWSAPGGGITDDPQRTLREVFDRLVGRHLKPT